jgi:hypothetical protein
MAGNATVIAADPTYSPDLAPSDFYLLGHARGVLRGQSFQAGGGLLSADEGIVGSFETWTLTKVFLEWMMKIEPCIEINSDYVGQAKIHTVVVVGFKR